MQLEIDQTGAGPLVAAPPAGSVAAEAYGWFCLGDWGNRANSFVPFAGHQAGSNGIVGLTDSSVLFVENIANHELGQYISYAAPATLSGACFQALLGSMSVYSSDNIGCNIASFDEAFV